jgi:hypothetical protein
MLKTRVGLACALFVVACADGDGDDHGMDSASGNDTTESSSSESSSSESSSSVSSDTDPGDTDPGDTEPGDTEPGDTEPGDTDSDPACVPPEVIVGCEGIEPPLADTTRARGIVVEAERFVLSFANVNDPAILCEEADVYSCNCESWQSTVRLTVTGALAVGPVSPKSVEVDAAAGDCFVAANSDGSVMDMEITEITETCVAGRVNVFSDFAETGDEFGFVLPRCN